ncbi:MAG: hypothetical protein AB7U75_01565 [Hyphomicrobiaceae bacterium]
MPVTPCGGIFSALREGGNFDPKCPKLQGRIIQFHDSSIVQRPKWDRHRKYCRRTELSAQKFRPSLFGFIFGF